MRFKIDAFKLVCDWLTISKILFQLEDALSWLGISDILFFNIGPLGYQWYAASDQKSSNWKKV